MRKAIVAAGSGCFLWWELRIKIICFNEDKGCNYERK
jgi:hypothetical protein